MSSHFDVRNAPHLSLYTLKVEYGEEVALQIAAYCAERGYEEYRHGQPVYPRIGLNSYFSAQGTDEGDSQLSDDDEGDECDECWPLEVVPPRPYDYTPDYEMVMKQLPNGAIEISSWKPIEEPYITAIGKAIIDLDNDRKASQKPVENPLITSINKALLDLDREASPEAITVGYSAAEKVRRFAELYGGVTPDATRLWSGEVTPTPEQSRMRTAMAEYGRFAELHGRDAIVGRR